MTDVTMDKAQRETARRRYGEHERAEFPARWRDEEPGGVEMVMLDADISPGRASAAALAAVAGLGPSVTPAA